MRKIYFLNILFVYSFLSFSQDFSVKTINPELRANANAVVRLNETLITLAAHDEMVIEVNRTITVLNESGNQYVNAYVGYDNFRKIKDLEALIYNENGEEIKKIKKRDFIDHSAVDGGTLYSDSRVLFMSYTPSYYPYTVALNYKIETKNTASIPSWSPITGYHLSIEKELFSLEDLAGLGLNTKTVNFELYNVIATTNENKISYELNNLKALSPEDVSPKFSDIILKASITVNKFHFYGVDGSATNWKEFGDWIVNELLAGRDKVSEETKSEVLALTKDIEDPIERAKRIYKYVQDNTRYISVQVGIGGVQPIPANEVDALKYGDCKGLTNYTLALLKLANVPAYYSIVEAGNDIVDFDDDFYSLAQGNHIILGVPDQENMYWLDCTSQVHPFGFIGDFTDNRKVLLVKEGDSKVIKTTSYINETNAQNLNAVIVLLEDGSFTSDIVIKTKGIQYDKRFLLENEKESDIKVYYKRFWDKINYLNITDYAFDNNRETVVFTERLSVEAEKYATIVNNKLIFQPNFFSRELSVPKRYKNRKQALEIQRGFLYEDENSITIPKNYELDYLPESEIINSKFGNYSISFKKEGDTISYSRKLLLKKGVYPKTDYNEYRDFLKLILKKDHLKIVLNKI